MSDIVIGFKPEFNKVIDHLKKDISALRVGRAAPSMVENIMVESYGALTPLVHLASIASPDPRTISITPWDKSLLKAIEKSLSKADIGGSPILKDDMVIVSIAPLSEEVRQEIVKKLSQKLEEGKVGIRNFREKAKEQILTKFKNKEITEDEKFKFLEELDSLVKEYNEQIRVLGVQKEEEIMKI